MNPNRGSFPKLDTPETPAERRARYETWIIATHDDSMIDPEYDAVISQPEHFNGNPAPSRPSMKQAVRARCWQCVSGDDDQGGTKRIADCALQSCAMWAIRPYQSDDAEKTTPADDLPKFARRVRVRDYCRDCQGGARTPHVARAVSDCNAVTCALWMVRQRVTSQPADPTNETAADPAAEPAAEVADQTGA